MKNEPDSLRLREVLSYDPATGLLRWKLNAGSRAASGQIAGTHTTKGHLVVRVDGHLLLAHRVAWSIHYGVAPAGLLRHGNKNKADNRIENLSITSKAELHAHTRSVPVSPVNVAEIFDYRSGKLYWKSSLTGKNRVEGREAGGLNENGYLIVEVGGRAISAHRIVWLMHHGQWPAGEIDHRNGIRHDNRIANLRDVVRETNAQNRRAATTGSRTGLLGVTVHKNGEFRARIRAHGRLHSLGLFDSAEAAHAAYVVAKRKLHAGCTI